MKERVLVRKSDVRQTCGISPSQWEGQTVEGVSLYIRYRWGRLTVHSPFDEQTFMDEPLLSIQLGDEYDGEMDTREMREHTGDTIKWID